MKIHLPGEKQIIVLEEAGVTKWIEPVGRHFIENTGDATIRVILVEVTSSNQ